MELLSLRIHRIVQQTPQSKTFYVERTDHRPIVYLPGQFITVLLHLQNKEVRRSYSLSSTPGVDNEVFFTIKRVDNGTVSRHLLDHLQTGDVLTVLPPAGRFTVPSPLPDQCTFIAAGSGITPVYSLIKYLLFKTNISRVILILQNHNEVESIFGLELRQLAKRFENRFQLIAFLSNPIGQNRFPQRLNNHHLEQLVKETAAKRSVHYFLCGPEAFMRMARFTLRVMGVGDTAISSEHFYAPKPVAPMIADQLPHTVTIHYGDQVHKLSVTYPNNILEVALQNGIELPYSCRGGRCSTCTARCTSGTIKMSINDVLTPQDIEQGLVLPCVAYPETDVEIIYEMNRNWLND